MLSGNRAVLQIAKQSAWKTPSTQSPRQIRFVSESLESVVSRAQEPVMTGAIGPSRYDVMGIRAEGNISILARPDDIGFFLLMAVGQQDTYVSGSKKHTFTPAQDSLPSFSAYVKRSGTHTDRIIGCKINTISFSAAPEDYLALELGIVAHKKDSSALPSTEVTPSAQKAFKFKQGKIFITRPSGTSTEIQKITNISLTYNNNLEAGIQTTTSEGHYEEPMPNTRQITVDMEFLRESNVVTGISYSEFELQDIEYEVQLTFTDESEFNLDFLIPHMQVTSFASPVSDANAQKVSVTLEAFDNGSDPLITITLNNNVNAAY
ncbi:MAG: hypothetical protein LBH75_04645 [Treponema sp.]|jgi:hypothetical protein|nr:hypothetical protein [Treponema sp.]